MIRVNQIKVDINNDNLLLKISKKLKIHSSLISKYKIIKKSIDARDKSNINYVYEVDVEIACEDKILKMNLKDVSKSPKEEYALPEMGNIKLNTRPIIVGSGPAGLFCAYLLAESGYKPIILERGEKVEDRVKTVEKFHNTNKLNINSNIQFGEGGAGTFSDGKLNTLTKDKSFRNKKVLETFYENGAPEEILYINKPHIGTDILREVIINMRNKILKLGGEIHYNSCVTNLIIEKDELKGVEVNNKDKIMSDIIVLAIGHSARDTFKMLHSNNLYMKPKNFAVGLRIEHPREMIDESQYGKFSKLLPSASYKLTYQTKAGRGVYSFCMCPGGYVINASSEENKLCINGMSNFKRDAKNSNSAIVVTITPEDFGKDIFSGVEFQEQIEKLAYKEGTGQIPVQTYKDFKENRVTTSFGEYTPNTKGDYKMANLNNVLPEYITSALKEAMPNFGKKIKNFDRDDAIFLGVESRTSSPIIIVRNEHFMSSINGIYPCGEGAGYAGGIITAAIDGIKVAEEIIKTYHA